MRVPKEIEHVFIVDRMNELIEVKVRTQIKNFTFSDANGFPRALGMLVNDHG